MNTTVVILAAGLGTRMRSKHAKVLHHAGGKALVQHVVEAALNITTPDRIVVVTGHQAERVEQQLADYEVRFVRQEGQKGTGHALESCRAAVSGLDGLLMVLYGDTPLLSRETLAELRNSQASSQAAATLITTTLEDPTGYGRVLLDPDDNVVAIVEEKACSDEQRQIHLINSGLYCFRADLLWKHLREVQPNAASGEYYLTDMAEILSYHGHRVARFQVDDSRELLGINTRVELAAADAVLRDHKSREWMLSGVTIERPETVTIDGQAKAGMDTIIEPFARILGNTKIGQDCRIGAGAILENAVLEDGAVVAPYTIISDSSLAAGAQVGPFARLRMQAEVGPDARVGNFVELKKTKLGAGSKSQHLAYLGDSEIGEKSNIGAGTITCNYDGQKKHKTQIGDGVFIGSNSTLVAPVEIGNHAYVAAGSVITDAVIAEALALGRARQVVKPEWRKKRKAQQSE